MNLWTQFCDWCAKPALAAERARAESVAVTLQCEAYQCGYAVGERAGAQRMLTAIEQVCYNRRGVEISQADIDQARKGSLH